MPVLTSLTHKTENVTKITNGKRVGERAGDQTHASVCLIQWN